MDWTSLIDNGFEALNIIFSLSLIACAFLFYCKTKIIYELTASKKLKYFRNILFFLGLSYLSFFIQEIIFGDNYILNSVWVSIVFPAIDIFIKTVLMISLFLFFFEKKHKNAWISQDYFKYVLGLIFAAVGIWIFIFGIILYVLMALFVFAMIIVLLIKNDKKIFFAKQKSTMYIIYIILFTHGIIAGILNGFSLICPLFGFLSYLMVYGLFCFMLIKFLRISHREKK